VVIKTAMSQGSFTADGGYRDLYFGDLLDFFNKSNKRVVIVGHVLNSYNKFVKCLKRNPTSCLFSIEQLLGIPDIVYCFLKALAMFYTKAFALQPVRPFRGIDMGAVVYDAVVEELKSSQYLVNLMNVQSTQRILQRNDVDRFILPFENRGWERLDMMALRTYSKRTRIIGYQHASISQKHTEYFRSPDDKLPLPDVIVSMGEITARMLVERGKFPAAIVKVGCALRQEWSFAENNAAPRDPANLLVCLSTSADYYERTIASLNDILRNADGLTIRLRAHPLIPLKDSLKSKIAFSWHADVESGDEKSLDWADVVLYSSSTTLALNGLQRGKPVFYVPVDDYLDSDPLFELSDAKWIVRTSKEFQKALTDLRGMEPARWKAALAGTQRYVKRYFGLVSPITMTPFLA